MSGRRPSFARRDAPDAGGVGSFSSPAQGIEMTVEKGKTRKKAKPQRNGEPPNNGGGISRLFGNVANRISQAAGRASVFMLAAGIIIVWGITGPLFQYSDTWQLVINTGTSVVTFLMVFLIQNSQNRDGAAIQVKLDELIRVSAAHNSFVGIEHLTDEELQDIRTKCERRAEAEKVGQASVKQTGEKAKEAVDRAVAAV
jgi:low affinity Fe/Cu permease